MSVQSQKMKAAGRTPGIAVRTCRAFTVIELLVVISILGIMAALTIPVLKNFGKADQTLGASRQLLDGVARARQLAISQRTTVYMVFVPTNFWMDPPGIFPNAWWNSLNLVQKTAVTNLCEKQLSGYSFITQGGMGDQPGNHSWHYLDKWQELPDNSFIAIDKFAISPSLSYSINDNITSVSYKIFGFATNAIPFPTATNLLRILPCLAFDYQGHLVSDADANGYRDADIPLAHGSVSVAIDPATKRPVVNPGASGVPDVIEMPPGNSTNITYSIVHIDHLTGRAVLQFHKMTP
jgi:prepilin-type N-terminal cleavage/methylation domain-containing protein